MQVEPGIMVRPSPVRAPGNLGQPSQHPRRRGAAAVETAIILPLALLMMIAIFEYARIVTLKQILDNAAREGARYAVVRVDDGSTTDAQILAKVEDYLVGFQDQFVNYNRSTNIQVYKANATTGANLGSWKDAGFGEGIAVKISGQVKLALPGFLFVGGRSWNLKGLQTLTLSAESTMYSEAN
jgi:hypothetical protein